MENTIGSRIIELRKHLSLTQEEFAVRIGCSRSAIGKYEIGRNIPLDPIITAICREFNASESWLRTGEGDMLIPVTPDQKLAMALGHMVRNPQPSRKLLLRILMELPEEDLDRFVEKIREIIRETDAPTG